MQKKVVYLLESGGFSKIGKASNIKQRLGSLRTGSPQGIQLLHTIPTDEPLKLERYFHRLFQENRVRGEWFNLSPEQVKQFLEYNPLQPYPLQSQTPLKPKNNFGGVQVNEERNPMKEVREALGLTQQAMADRLQISLMTARRCEYEKRMPGTLAARKGFLKLAKEAGVDLETAESNAAVS